MERLLPGCGYSYCKRTIPLKLAVKDTDELICRRHHLPYPQREWANDVKVRGKGFEGNKDICEPLHFLVNVVKFHEYRSPQPQRCIAQRR